MDDIEKQLDDTIDPNGSERDKLLKANARANESTINEQQDLNSLIEDVMSPNTDKQLATLTKVKAGVQHS